MTQIHAGPNKPLHTFVWQNEQEGQPSKLSSWVENHHGCHTSHAQTIPGESLSLSPWHHQQSRNSSFQGGQLGSGAAEETSLAFLLVLRGVKWLSCSSPAFCVGTGRRTDVASPQLGHQCQCHQYYKNLG